MSLYLRTKNCSPCGAAPCGGCLVPAITSSLSVGATVCTAFSYTITATNSPTSFGATGLPPGLSLDPTTGVISGTPTGGLATYSVAISATNACGTGSATLSIELGGYACALDRSDSGFFPPFESAHIRLWNNDEFPDPGLDDCECVVGPCTIYFRFENISEAATRFSLYVDGVLKYETAYLTANYDCNSVAVAAGACRAWIVVEELGTESGLAWHIKCNPIAGC